MKIVNTVAEVRVEKTGTDGWIGANYGISP